MAARAIFLHFPTVASIPSRTYIPTGFKLYIFSQNMPAPTLQPYSPIRGRGIKKTLTYRRLANALAAAKGVRKTTHTYLDYPPLRIQIHHGIRPGEVANYIELSYDWTQEWEWTLCVYFSLDNFGHKAGHGTFYFKDLPTRLKETVPWKDAEQTSRVRADENLQRDPEGRFADSRKFCHRGEPALWSGWFFVKGWDREQVVNTDLWDLMESWPIIS